jgi:hypothetical protein
MKPRHMLIFLIAVTVVGLMGQPMAVAETINTQDYWVLSDGYSEDFTNNGEVTVSYGPYSPYITEDVYDVDWPGSTGATHQFFQYDSGALKYYGARFQDTQGGDSWVYVPSGAQDFLPSVLEVGKSYTSAWSRSEYKNGTYQGLGSDSYTITVTGPHTTTVSAGTFTTYQLALVNTWQTSTGISGTSSYTYYLSSGIGWVKMIRGGVTYELMSYESEPSKPTKPRLSVSTSDVTLSLSWTAQANGEGYTLFYAPYPYTGPETIGTIDMGAETGGSFSLWEGAAFYLAVEAYNSFGNSGLSNIEHFIMGYSLSVSPSSHSLSAGQAGSCTISGGTTPYSAVSSNTAVATVSVSGNILSVTGVSEGSATITLSDSGGDSGTISVTVVSSALRSTDYFITTLGHGIKYRITDTYDGFDEYAWADVTCRENTVVHEFVITIDIPYGSGNGSYENNLVGKEKFLQDGVNYTQFWAGCGVGNQGNFYFPFIIPYSFEIGDEFTGLWQGKLSVEDLGLATVNGIDFTDCIKVNIDNTASSYKSEYTEGTGYFILAKGVGIIELVFKRTNPIYGGVVTYSYQEQRMLTNQKTSNCEEDVCTW